MAENDDATTRASMHHKTSLSEEAAEVDADEDWIEFTVNVDDLEARWLRLMNRVTMGTPSTLAAQWWDDLKQRHSESQRHYHTLAHLAELLSFLDSTYGRSISFERRDLVELAVFFHDAVYAPKSKTNEEDSAELFRRFANDVHLPEESATEVYNWILWTKAHDAPAGTPEDALLFLDFDMAVLSKPWDAYYKYAAQIRQEFVHVPVEAYLTGRPAYFERQLSDASHRFYVSNGLAHFEARARSNLARECALLNTGQVPSCEVPPSRH